MPPSGVPKPVRYGQGKRRGIGSSEIQRDVNKFVNVSKTLEEFFEEHNQNHSENPEMQYDSFPDDGLTPSMRNRQALNIIDEHLEELLEYEKEDGTIQSYYGKNTMPEVPRNVMKNALTVISKDPDLSIYRQCINNWAIKELVKQKMSSKCRNFRSKSSDGSNPGAKSFRKTYARNEVCQSRKSAEKRTIQPSALDTNEHDDQSEPLPLGQDAHERVERGRISSADAVDRAKLAFDRANKGPLNCVTDFVTPRWDNFTDARGVEETCTVAGPSGYSDKEAPKNLMTHVSIDHLQPTDHQNSDEEWRSTAQNSCVPEVARNGDKAARIRALRAQLQAELNSSDEHMEYENGSGSYRQSMRNAREVVPTGRTRLTNNGTAPIEGSSGLKRRSNASHPDDKAHKKQRGRFR